MNDALLFYKRSGLLVNNLGYTNVLMGIAKPALSSFTFSFVYKIPLVDYGTHRRSKYCPNQRPILRARAPSFLSSKYAKCIWLDEVQIYPDTKALIARLVSRLRVKVSCIHCIKLRANILTRVQSKGYTKPISFSSLSCRKARTFTSSARRGT